MYFLGIQLLLLYFICWKAWVCKLSFWTLMWQIKLLLIFFYLVLCLVLRFAILNQSSSVVNDFSFTYRYIFTFALGAGPVTGIIIPELSSALTRSKIMGFSFSVHWVCITCYFFFDAKQFHSAFHPFGRQMISIICFDICTLLLIWILSTHVHKILVLIYT